MIGEAQPKASRAHSSSAVREGEAQPMASRAHSSNAVRDGEAQPKAHSKVKSGMPTE
jgi:hypothetical protein